MWSSKRIHWIGGEYSSNFYNFWWIGEKHEKRHIFYSSRVFHKPYLLNLFVVSIILNIKRRNELWYKKIPRVRDIQINEKFNRILSAQFIAFVHFWRGNWKINTWNTTRNGRIGGGWTPSSKIARRAARVKYRKTRFSIAPLENYSTSRSKHFPLPWENKISIALWKHDSWFVVWDQRTLPETQTTRLCDEYSRITRPC